MSCGRQYYGIILIVLSCFFDTITGVLVQSTTNRTLMDIVGLSQIVQMILILPLIIYKNVKFKFKQRTNLLISLHCLTGALGNTVLYYSYTVLPLGDATAIYSTNSVFSCVFSFFIFKKSFRWSIVISCLVCVIGVITVCQPHSLLGDDEQVYISYKGIAAALLASILDSLYFNFNSLLEKVNYLLLAMYLTTSMILLWSFYLIIEQRLPVIGFEYCSWTNFYITSIGLAGLLCVLAVTRGFQLVETGPGSIACCSGIIFGYVFQHLIQHSLVRLRGIAGALLIIMSMLISSWNISYKKSNIPEYMTENSHTPCYEGNPRNEAFKEVDSCVQHLYIDKE